MQDKTKFHRYFQTDYPKAKYVGLGGGDEPIPSQQQGATARDTTVDAKIQTNLLQQKLAQMVLLIGDVSKEINNQDKNRLQDKPDGYKRKTVHTTPNLMKSSHTHNMPNHEDEIENLEKKVLETSRKKVLGLELEKNKLTEQLRDVIAMNTRWQLYDGQREDYVVQLNLKLTALQKQLDELCAHDCKAKDNVDHVEDSSKEKIQALEYQVKTSQEDFELERLDRARVQGQLQQLKEKFEEAERDNKHQKDLIFFYQAQLGELRRGFDEPDLRAPFMHNINKPRHRHYQRRFAGGLSGDVEVDDINDFDVVDSSCSGTYANNLILSDDVEVDGDVTRDETDGGVVELLCPKCSKHFAYSEHDKLVEHMDRC